MSKKNKYLLKSLIIYAVISGAVLFCALYFLNVLPAISMRFVLGIPANWDRASKILLEKGEKQKAEAILLKACAEIDYSPELYSRTAFVLLENNKYNDFIAMFQKAEHAWFSSCNYPDFLSPVFKKNMSDVFMKFAKYHFDHKEIKNKQNMIFHFFIAGKTYPPSMDIAVKNIKESMFDDDISSSPEKILLIEDILPANEFLEILPSLKISEKWNDHLVLRSKLLNDSRKISSVNNEDSETSEKNQSYVINIDFLPDRFIELADEETSASSAAAWKPLPGFLYNYNKVFHESNAVKKIKFPLKDKVWTFFQNDSVIYEANLAEPLNNRMLYIIARASSALEMYPVVEIFLDEKYYTSIYINSEQWLCYPLQITSAFFNTPGKHKLEIKYINDGGLPLINSRGEKTGIKEDRNLFVASDIFIEDNNDYINHNFRKEQKN